jgi:hypothetical protein
MGKSRYTRVFDVLWDDENIVSLSDDAKLLYLYIMTCRHGNAAGAYIISKGTIADDLRWQSKRLCKPFTELLSKGFILYDEAVRVIVIVSHLKHNSPEGPNQEKNIASLLAELPKTKEYSTFIKRLDKPFHKPLTNGLAKRIPNAVTVPVTVTVTVKKDITPKEEKTKFLDCVMLKESEHEKLITSFGDKKTKDLIQRLNDYIMSKGKKYSSHYHTILSWERKDGNNCNTTGSTGAGGQDYPTDITVTE